MAVLLSFEWKAVSKTGLSAHKSPENEPIVSKMQTFAHVLAGNRAADMITPHPPIVGRE